MNIREATKEAHDAVEKTEFSQKLLNGTYLEKEYVKYLNAQFFIFQSIEVWGNYTLPHKNLNRRQSILDDLEELNESPKDLNIVMSAKNYGNWLLGEHSTKKRNSHIYLNYLGLMFGGSMMAKHVPTSGRIYQFENRSECISVIRELELDVETVNTAFNYHRLIMEELNQ